MPGLNGPALQGVDVFGLSHVCTTAGFIDSTNPEAVCLCIACAVSAMLSEVVGCGGGGDLEIDVVLGQEELTEKSLQLTHLLSPGFIPVSVTQTHTKTSYYDVYNHVDASSDSYSHLARPSVSKKTHLFFIHSPNFSLTLPIDQSLPICSLYYSLLMSSFPFKGSSVAGIASVISK